MKHIVLLVELFRALRLAIQMVGDRAGGVAGTSPELRACRQRTVR
jgi:hypothetical protein